MGIRHLIHSRATRTVAIVAGLTLVAAACGGSTTESGLEKLIEQQAGGDVDLDLDPDGGFSIQTEDGGLSIDEDGNFVITGEDGEVLTGNADGDGNFSINGEDGSVDGNSEEGDDGSFSINSGGDVPSEWPGEVPLPDNFSVTTSSSFGNAESMIISLIGDISSDPNEFIDSYSAALTSSGFEQISSFETEGNVVKSFDDGSWNISLGVLEGPQGLPVATISLTTSP